MPKKGIWPDSGGNNCYRQRTTSPPPSLTPFPFLSLLTTAVRRIGDRQDHFIQIIQQGYLEDGPNNYG